MIKPQVAQARHLAHPHARQRCHRREQARPVRTERGRPQASSQRIVAFWIGSFSADGHPRMEPSIRAHDENWLASDIGGLSWN